MQEHQRNPVLILTGAPGSGKTIVARLLARKFKRAAHIEADRFFHFIQSGYIEPWKPESHEQNTTVMRIAAETAASYAAGGYFTILDGIVSPRWFFEPLRDSLRANGRLVAYAVLRAPLATCLARVELRASNTLSDSRVVERLWRDFADLGPFEGHAIDSGAQTAEVTAAVLSEQLQSGLLLV